jgi:hypothetical protein
MTPVEIANELLGLPEADWDLPMGTIANRLGVTSTEIANAIDLIKAWEDMTGKQVTPA